MTGVHARPEPPSPKEPSFQNAFLIAVTANAIFVVFQIVFAYITNSASLLADGVHNLGDVLSLTLAWVANYLLARQPTDHSTYGMKKTTILASFANAALLIFTCGIIATESVYKFFSPSPIEAVGVMMVAAMGIAVNGFTAVLFIRGQDDLNIRAAFLHLTSDALISLGVVISAALIYWTKWQWIDPVVGLLIAVIILKSTWSLLTDSFRLMIDAVPKNVSLEKVRNYLLDQPGVEGIHDLHIWAMSTKENALSVHLWMPKQSLSDVKRQSMTQVLSQDYQIQHVTIQVETDKQYCEDACVPYLGRVIN